MADDNSIDIKVTATTADLESGLSKATGEVKDFGAEVNSLAERVAAVKPDAFKELAEQFNAGKLDLDEFRDGLIATSAASSAAATEAKALAEGTALSSGSMRELVVVARELASGNLTRLPGSLTLLAQRLGGISPAAILGAAGIAAFGYAIYSAIDSSEKFQKTLTGIQLELQASGRGGSYNETFVTQLMTNFRQATDVTNEQAQEMTHAFESIRTLSQADLETISENLVRFKSVVGENSEQAAKELEKAFGGDTFRFIQDLSKEFGVYTPAQLDAARAAKEMGDQATLSKLAMQGFLDVANNATEENATGIQKFFNRLSNNFNGINEGAAKARDALLAQADALDKLGDAESRYQAQLKRDAATAYTDQARNIPQRTEPSKPNAPPADPQADDRAKQVAAETAGLDIAHKINSAYEEREHHLTRLKGLQDALNAAQKLGDEPHATEIRSAIDQENQNYDKKQDKRAPAVDTSDNDFQALINQEAEKGLRDQQQQDQARIESDAKVGEAKLKTAEDTAKQQYALGQVTAEQEQAQLLALANQSNAIEQARFDQLATLYKNDAAKYTELMAQKQQAEQKFQEQVQQIDATAAQRKAALEQKEQQQFDQSVQKMIGPWESALSNMGTRTNVWAQAVIQSQRMIESNLVSGVARMAANWLLGENEKSAATAIGAKFRELTQSQGSSEAVQQNIQNTETNQSTDAVGVFTNVFNYLSPELGPFAAAPAAAASAAVLALSLPSAAGGWVVPNDTLAMVHESEMILPAHLSQGIGSMIANGQSGGGTTNHFNVNVAAHGRLNADDLDGLHDAVVGSLRKAARNGQLGGMR